MKRIPVSMDTWRKLRQIRDNLGFQHFNRTIEWLLQQSCFQDKNTITLDSEIFDRLMEIKSDNNFDTFSQTIDCLADELQECQEREEHGGH